MTKNIIKKLFCLFLVAGMFFVSADPLLAKTVDLEGKDVSVSFENFPFDPDVFYPSVKLDGKKIVVDNREDDKLYLSVGADITEGSKLAEVLILHIGGQEYYISDISQNKKQFSVIEGEQEKDYDVGIEFDRTAGNEYQGLPLAFDLVILVSEDKQGNDDNGGSENQESDSGNGNETYSVSFDGGGAPLFDFSKEEEKQQEEDDSKEDQKKEREESKEDETKNNKEDDGKQRGNREEQTDESGERSGNNQQTGDEDQAGDAGTTPSEDDVIVRGISNIPEGEEGEEEKQKEEEDKATGTDSSKEVKSATDDQGDKDESDQKESSNWLSNLNLKDVLWFLGLLILLLILFLLFRRRKKKKEEQ